MSIRSVDLQVLLPRVQEVGRNQQIQQQNPEQLQQEFAKQLQQTTERQQKTVQPTPDGERVIIHDEEKDSSQQQWTQEQEQKQIADNEMPEKKLSDKNLGNLIDIKA